MAVWFKRDRERERSRERQPAKVVQCWFSVAFTSAGTRPVASEIGPATSPSTSLRVIAPACGVVDPELVEWEPVRSVETAPTRQDYGGVVICRPCRNWCNSRESFGPQPGTSQISAADDPRSFVDRSEMLQERGAAHRSEPGEVVENRFADFLRAEVGVVRVGETMGFVAQALEQLQSGVIERQVEWRPLVGEDDGFVFLRQPDERWRREIERGKGLERSADLALPAIDDHKVRKIFFSSDSRR